ncbi:MAG TPA: toll/interleukin-1 receptor domain-containing protein, partial [Verrucomicrobiae bacterium]|nr:toll/interleukin-1 receptor domain-containing protein [Verrucomicrobiae bacterium]
MKLFLSWSGELSHKIALALKGWLPSVIQSLKPYVSSEDIQKGARWSQDVEKELAESRFGIICLTPDNLAAPWIHFEAGALSKAIPNASTAVCPLLFNLRQSDVPGPLEQFQNVRNEKGDIFKLMSSINRAEEASQQLEPSVLKKAFDKFWPELSDQLNAFAELPVKGKPQTPRDEREILEELLEISRAQQRLLATRNDLAGFLAEFGSELAQMNAAKIPPLGFASIGTGTLGFNDMMKLMSSRVPSGPNYATPQPSIAAQ